MKKPAQNQALAKAASGEYRDPLLPLLERYEGSALRPLVHLITPRLDSSLELVLSRIRARRAQAFFDALDESPVLTPEVIESEAFVQRFEITARAALNTRRLKKIEAFASILAGSLTESLQSDDEEYEELLQILDALTEREMAVLDILHRFETSETPRSFLEPVEDTVLRVTKYWSNFCIAVQRETGVSIFGIGPVMARLSRKGCVEIFGGAHGANPGNQGRLTGDYNRLRVLIGPFR